MKRLTQRQRVDAAGLGALAAITAAGYLAGLSPMLSARDARAATEESVQEAAARSQSLRADVDGQEKRLRELQKALGAVAIQLQPASRLNTRLNELNGLVSESGLVVVSQQQDQPSYQARFGTLAIRLKAQGTYGQCTAFLRRLGQQCKDMGIESLELSGPTVSTTGAGQQADLIPQMAVSLVWFVEPPAPKK